MHRCILAGLIWAVACGSAAADIRVDLVDQVAVSMSGRKAMNMNGRGTRRSIVIKGDRRLSASETEAELVDLKEEVVYRLDLRQRRYVKLAFADLRRQPGERPPVGAQPMNAAPNVLG